MSNDSIPEDTEVIPISSVSESCNSATGWALANFWIQRCASSHGKCRRLASTESKLPTRLVDLGPEAYAVRPRLCRSVDLLQDTRYATLSHRWGGSVMSMLTLATVQIWTDAIPISILSSTFKEAMEVTKRLGMRYLWIDSLCIIQDSEEDWRRESAAMGDVYRNAHCSISAAAGHNQGLFVQRDPRDVYPCVIKPQHALWTGGDCQEWYCLPRDIFEQNVTRSPLFTRGWVVQEHILAPRILHFTKQQIFWECLELQACESLPAGVLNTRKLRQKKLGIDTFSLPGEYYDTPYKKTAEREFLWNEFVERFSTTTLTYPDKDKLAALSGLAKAVGVKSEYLAGMWREHLAVHLMWGRHGGSAILERPEKYQAPSWSWASVNGQIFTTRVWPLKGEKIVADVLDAHVELVSEDPTGPVKAGYLRMRGCLAHVAVRKWPPREGYVEIWDYNINEDDKIQCHPDVDFDEDQDEVMLYAFLITLDSDYPFKGAGILLEPTGARKGEFYRRGRFLCGPYQKEELFQPFLDLFRTSATTLNPDCFISGPEHVESAYGFPIYEISIL
jgi:hypothetical protein